MLQFLEDEIKEEEKALLEKGSAGRYELRKRLFLRDGKLHPKLRHYGWWFLHNCIAHPMLGVVPCTQTFQLHDWTSKKLNHG